MTEIKYTKSHEWIKLEGDRATVGITDYAQSQLGDVVFVSLPEAGKNFKASDEVAVVESVKTASEIYSPVSGEIAEVNSLLEDAPEKINSDAMGDGWIYKIKLTNQGELSALLDEVQYNEFLKELH
ncbi:MAG: glycine cleavage system protein GcvH [Alphaproteobacteria bacterium]